MKLTRWEITLTQRGKEVVLDCLEAGLEAYEEDDDTEACDVLRNLIDLFKKED